MTKNLAKSKFWSAPVSPLAFKTEIDKNQILHSLWQDVKIDHVNASTTLPLEIKPKREVFKQVQLQYPDKTGLALKFKQTVSYGKLLIKFYKSGVTNVWHNNKTYKTLAKQRFKLGNQVVNGQAADIRMPSFEKLTHHMSQTIFMNKVENEKFNQTTVKDHSKGNYTITPNLFNLTRAEYQLIKRTPKDFIKLPIFVMIFAIFVEMTPLLCYAMPQITPLTCVLPSIAPRIWNANNMQQVTEVSKELLHHHDAASLSVRTSYNLPLNQVRNVVKSLNLVSKYVPINLYPETILRDRLQHHFNYLTVDNYYLSGLNGNGNIWNLSLQELLTACLERNLITDLNHEVEQYEQLTNESGHQQLHHQYMAKLRGYLVKFIVDFQTSNIGYLTITQCIDPIDVNQLNQYHVDK